MVELNIIADAHIYGVDPIYNNATEMPLVDVLLGDIIDLANCKKDKLEEAKQIQTELLTQYRTSYVSGNHDLLTTNKQLKIGKILVTHGDYILWGDERANAFRTQPPGAGAFSRFWKKGLSKTRLLINAHLSNEELDALVHHAIINGATTIIIGHIHPKKLIDVTHKGVRIIACKRGLNKITVKD